MFIQWQLIGSQKKKRTTQLSVLSTAVQENRECQTRFTKRLVTLSMNDQKLSDNKHNALQSKRLTISITIKEADNKHHSRRDLSMKKLSKRLSGILILIKKRELLSDN